MDNLQFYEQINLALLLSSAGLVFFFCLLPLPSKRYVESAGVIYELPPLEPVLQAKYPVLADKLFTLFYICVNTLLFSASFFMPDEAAENSVREPGLLEAWIDMLFPLFLYMPLLVRYTSTFNSEKWVSLRSFLLVIPALMCIYVLNIVIDVSGFYEWLIHVTGSPEMQQSVKTLKQASPVEMMPLAVSAIVIAPIVEEIFFRGFIFRLLSCRIGIVSAALLSGILFGAVHLSLIQTVALSIFGFVQCMLYAQTRSIIYPMILHAIFNAIVVIQIFFIPSA